MKKILGLTIAALLIVGVIGGATYAYFSDTESSVNNTLSGGTLDLNIDGGDIAVTTVNVTDVAPGESGSGNSTLANVGNLEGELDISTSAVTNAPGAGGTEYEGGSGELGANAEIAMYIDVDQSSDWSSGDIGLKSDGTKYNHPTALDYDVINNYASESWDATENMTASAADYFFVLWQVGTGVGNEIQGDSASFDITFVLEQGAAD
jgi:spore coat-associated protein N